MIQQRLCTGVLQDPLHARGVEVRYQVEKDNVKTPEIDGSVSSTSSAAR
jgi:hypothetical protein